MPAPDYEASDLQAGLLAFIRTVKRDIFDYLNYLIDTGVDVPPPSTILSWPDEKLIGNRVAIDRLMAARNELAQLAAPVTAERIRISRAVAGMGKTDEVMGPVAHRLRLTWNALWAIAFVLAPLSAYLTWFFFRVTHIPDATVASATDRDIELGGIRLSDVARLALPPFYGLLGATAPGLRLFHLALHRTMLDGRITTRIWFNLAMGLLAGAIIGLLARPLDLTVTAVAFLAGVCAPGLFSFIDSAISWIFLPKELVNTERRVGIDMLQPINLTTHLTTGAIITAAFLLSCILLAPQSVLWDGLPSSLQAAPRTSSVLPPLATLGGALGAWAHVTKDILWTVAEQGKQAEQPKIPLPFLRYLAGAGAGVGIAYILPNSVLADPAAMDAFNPFALALLAIVTGYAAARSLRNIIGSVDRMLGGGSASVVEEGVRRALTPPPLVNYRGYMVAALLDPNDLSSYMVADTAKIPATQTDFVLDLRFGPEKPEDTSSALIAVEGGTAEGDAAFDVEISAAGFEPRRRRLRLTARTGIVTRTEPLTYTMLRERTPEAEMTFRLTVTQSGRVVQFNALNVVTSDES